MNLPVILNILAFRVLFLLHPDISKGSEAEIVYPTPPLNEHSLFYIQRSNNTNAIVYEANILNDGKINEVEPVKVFWIRYSEDSTAADLNYIQRKYAYGVNASAYANQKNKFVVQFVAYSKKSIYLLPKTNGKYAAYTNINGKLAELKKIWIELSGGTFWFPTIDYIEMIGKDPVSQQVVSERFKPRR